MFLKKNGFTIIEVVVASIILIISLLGGVIFLSANRSNLAYASQQRLATWGAIYKIEQLESATYADTNPLLYVGTTSEPSLVISGKSFTRTTAISYPETGKDYKQAIVSVSWPQGKAPVSLTTYISDK